MTTEEMLRIVDFKVRYPLLEDVSDELMLQLVETSDMIKKFSGMQEKGDETQQ